MTLAGVELRFGKKGKIRVEPGATLRLLPADGRGCVLAANGDRMWVGIEVDGGSLVIQNAVVRDAKLGVDAHSSSSGANPRIELRNTVFDRNKNHIRIANVLNANPAQDFVVQGCTLKCVYPLMAPHFGEFTHKGIEIVNPSPNVNPTYDVMYDRPFDISNNYFTEMQYGLWTKFAGLKAFGNTFDNLRGGTNEAIRFEGSAFVPGFTFSPQYYELTVGRPGSGNVFRNCKAGVVLPNAPSASGLQTYHAANLRIESNVFENMPTGTAGQLVGGVYLNHWTANSARHILNNTFLNAVRGVTARRTQGNLVVSGNSFTGNSAVSTSSRTGVWVEDVRSGTVDVRGNVFSGINLGVVALIQNSTVPSVYVQSNEITLPGDGYGVLAWGGRNLNVLDNDFVKISGTPATGIAMLGFGHSALANNLVQNAGTGIQLGQSSFVSLSCNRLVGNAAVGVNAASSCLNASLKMNVFTQNGIGFGISNAGVVGPQGTAAGTVHDNLWSNNVFDLFSQNSNGTLSRFFVRTGTNAGLHYTPQTSGPPGGMLIPTTVISSPDGSGNPACSGPWPGGGGTPGGNTDLSDGGYGIETDFETALAAAEGTGAWTPAGLYAARRQLFDAWLLDPSRFAADARLTAFFVQYEPTPAGRLATAEWTAATGDFAAALALNAAVVPDNELDAAQKTVNELYFDAEVSGVDTFDAAQIRAAEAVARECPEVLGKAVFDARALLAARTGTLVLTDECTPASPAEERRAAQNADEPKRDYGFEVHPNPAKAFVTVRFKSDADIRNASLEILDVKGRSVMTRELDAHTEISVAELPAGFYYCRFRLDGATVATQKLVVVK